MPTPPLLAAVARAFLAGEADVESIVERSSRMLGGPYRWLRPLAERYVAAVSGRTRPRKRDVIRFIRDDPGFGRARSKRRPAMRIEEWLGEPQRMQPVPAAASWNIPIIESVGDLAVWLGLEPGDLDWFADLRAWAYRQNRPLLDHYHYRILTKQYGNIRLIEAPKPRIKQLQRQILSGILDRIPPHPAVHGFRKGRSIRTFAAPHAGQRVVLRMDLRDFFPALAGVRIQALFRTMGYPEAVADLLGGVCTNAVAREVWNAAAAEIRVEQLREMRSLYARPHVPQGAPTSPALANLCTYRADCRLTGLAQSAGAVYTRYADDLVFSGGEMFDRRVDRFSIHVASILHEEGFSVHHRKTRIMRQGVRQHMAGVVTNQRVNIRRDDFDRLKAILTNCVREGPLSQNRENHPNFRAHLEGRVGFVESINPGKGQRLRRIFEEIRWV